MRKLALTVTLACYFAASSARAQTVDLAVPELPRLDPGLSAPYDDPIYPGSVCLKPDTQAAVTEIILWARHYPQLCREITVAQAKNLNAKRDAAVDALNASHAAELSTVKASRPTWFKVTLIVGAAVVVSATAGYVAGKVLP